MSEADDTLVFKPNNLRSLMSAVFSRTVDQVRGNYRFGTGGSVPMLVCHVKDGLLTPKYAHTANRLAFSIVRDPLESNGTANTVSRKDKLRSKA
jgi:hypothetical protein